MTFRYFISTLLCGAALLFTGCSLVDEDLSDCGSNVLLHYRLRLVTNATAELDSQLGEAEDAEIRQRLTEYLENIITDKGHDLDLSLYDTVPPMSRFKHTADNMNGSNEWSIAPYLPVGTFWHTAVANFQGNGSLMLEEAEAGAEARLVQYPEDGVVRPQTAGLYTGRRELPVLYGVSQEEEVLLYMANSATALVVDQSQAPSVQSVNVMVSGFATEFRVSDSTYVYASEGKDPLVATDVLATGDGGTVCYASVHFPSHPETGGSKAPVSPLWKWVVHAKMADGTTTESILEISQELPNGYLKILKTKLLDNGVVATSEPLVGVSVTLDWKTGNEFEIEF